MGRSGDSPMDGPIPHPQAANRADVGTRHVGEVRDVFGIQRGRGCIDTAASLASNAPLRPHFIPVHVYQGLRKTR